MENSFQSVKFNNFDPNEVTTDEIINAVLIVDVSPSISSFVNDLNAAFYDFVSEMQKSHVAEKLMISLVEFSEKVTVKFGFKPINDIDLNLVKFTPQGSGTALYDAVQLSLQNAIEYRENLEASGVNCKTFIFAITDGQDNSSKNRASVIANQLDTVLSNEKNSFSFETILFGIGNAHEFTVAQQDMGFKHLAVVGNTGKEVRKLIGFISASISKSSSGNMQVVTF